MAADTIMGPVHPGEILLEEFLKPLGISQYQLAKEIGVPARRINEIVHGQRRISADSALRLARFFATSERFWISLQSRYDLEVERDRLGDALDGIRPLTVASRVVRTWGKVNLPGRTLIMEVSAGRRRAAPAVASAAAWAAG